jgi:hypothetical protein
MELLEPWAYGPHALGDRVKDHKFIIRCRVIVHYIRKPVDKSCATESEDLESFVVLERVTAYEQDNTGCEDCVQGRAVKPRPDVNDDDRQDYYEG